MLLKGLSRVEPPLYLPHRRRKEEDRIVRSINIKKRGR
jgi:hypothetical protein